MRCHKFISLLLLMPITLLTTSCGSDESVSALASGTWRGVITLPGGELPFQMQVLDTADGDTQAYIINGKERVPVTALQVQDDQVKIDFPAFNNHMVGRLKNNVIEGELVLVKRHGVKQHMPLRIVADTDYRFFARAPIVNADFTGKWEVEFVEDDGTKSAAIADLHQKNGEVTGTIRTPKGDYRFLAGEVENRTLLLSTFDGAHAFLFRATMDDNDKLAGDFWSGTEWHESWSARRNDNATLPDPNQLARIKDSDQPFVVAFPDVDGKIVRSDAAQFKNKVLIVALAGTWCPNCHDEAAFLMPFYQEYKDQGLEILGLMYEHLDSFDEAAKQVDKFRSKFKIDYTLLVAGSSDKSKASETLPMLSEVIAFPTMIVLDRKGQVRRVHSGFDGPGTGEVFENFQVEFTRFIQSLINEEQS